MKDVEKVKIKEVGQWEVRTDESIEAFDTKNFAKRSFGMLKKELIASEEEGAVYLYWREDINSEWIMMQRYIVGEGLLSNDEKEDLGEDDEQVL